MLAGRSWSPATRSPWTPAGGRWALGKACVVSQSPRLPSRSSACWKWVAWKRGRCRRPQAERCVLPRCAAQTNRNLISLHPPGWLWPQAPGPRPRLTARLLFAGAGAGAGAGTSQKRGIHRIFTPPLAGRGISEAADLHASVDGRRALPRVFLWLTICKRWPSTNSDQSNSAVLCWAGAGLGWTLLMRDVPIVMTV